MSAYTQAVKSGLEGLDFVSVGYIEHDKCSECPEEQNGDEGHFSWSACGVCNSSLGGDRFAAHGMDTDGNLVHLDVCVDCLQYIANGTEPEEWEHD